VALESEGVNFSPVELAVPMSEQTQTTAGHGLDPLGPAVLEGNPEALQTDAMPAPIIISQGQTESINDNLTTVPTPALNLAADTTHPASSVWGAGAAGTGPPPSGPGAVPTSSQISTFRDPSCVQRIGDASKFPTLVRQLTQQSPCTILLWQSDK